MSWPNPLSCCLLLFGALNGAPVAAELRIAGAWILEPPPVAVPAAGYLTLRNDGREPVVIASVRSPVFEHVEWHATVLEGGVARMRRVESPEIAGGAVLEMRPGGQHLMLFSPRRRLAAGMEIPLVIETTAGETLHALAPVRAAGDEGPDAGPAHHHSHHH